MEEIKENKVSKNNPMKDIKIEKLTLNVGVGEPGEVLKRTEDVINNLVPVKPIRTVCRAKVPTWGVREGLQIGVKSTLRGNNAIDFFKKVLQAKENRISSSNFDKLGNFGFGIAEHIDIPGVKYDPKLGIIGMDILVTLSRPGYRVKKKRYNKGKVGKSHLITKQEAIEFVKDKFGVDVNG